MVCASSFIINIITSFVVAVGLVDLFLLPEAAEKSLDGEERFI